jgi:hypothetical protein
MPSLLRKAALSIVKNFGISPGLRRRNAAAVDKDAEWQRVNSYIADVLKDSHVLYAKLARLQGDFVGAELDRLMQISEATLTIGEELSNFSRSFYDGKLQMADTDLAYGQDGGGGGGGGAPGGASGGPPGGADAELFQPFGDTGTPPSAVLEEEGEDLPPPPEPSEPEGEEKPPKKAPKKEEKKEKE